MTNHLFVLQIYKVLSDKVGNKTSAKNDDHEDDKQAVTRHARVLALLIREETFSPDFNFIAWNMLANPAMGEEDNEAQQA